MRIAYVASDLWTFHPGLQLKILGATKVWSQMGYEVFIVIHSQGLILDYRGNILESIKQPTVDEGKISFFDLKLSKLKRIFLLRNQYKFLRYALEKLNPDVLYTRYTFPFPGVHRNFNRVCPYIVEINSDDLVELKIKSKLTGTINSLFRKSFLSKAAGLCFVSHEMSVSASFSWYQGNTQVISNSIDCSRLTFMEKTGNSEINICFIGSPKQNWHGLDKVLLMAKKFPKWIFHIIGPSQKELELYGDTTLENLVVHGYLNGSESENIIGRMDVGISTLALHRKKMNEASPLKSRQYLAQGVPFISGYKDTDIKVQPFVLQLENLENNIESSLLKIENFVTRVYRNEHLRSQARQFAVDRLDADIKEKQRAKFIFSVVK